MMKTGLALSLLSCNYMYLDLFGISTFVGILTAATGKSVVIYYTCGTHRSYVYLHTYTKAAGYGELTAPVQYSTITLLVLN